MIDDLRKLIFIHIEKTGGTSIAMALFGRDEGASKKKGSDMEYDSGLTKHYSVQKARQVYGNEKWATYTKFSVVRNPWDRLVSKWCWRREGMLRKSQKLPTIYELDANGHIPKAWFIEEIREECQRWQLKSADDFLFGPGGLTPIVDHVLRFECLESDWNGLVKQAGWSTVTSLPHVNRSAERADDYRVYYNDETNELVRRQFGRTIAYCNYSF